MGERMQIYGRKERIKRGIIKYAIHMVLLIILIKYQEHIINEAYVSYYINNADTFHIDYEPFRQLGIVSEYIDQLLENQGKVRRFFPDKYDAMDYFTMTMIINQYDGSSYRKINKKYLNDILDAYQHQEDYQRIRSFYSGIYLDIKSFPVKTYGNRDFYSYVNTWNEPRSYGGNRRHEGTDIIPHDNASGKYKVISMTDGVVEKIGWLEQGGYRIGIRSPHGGYFYYAHLDSWVEGLKKGDTISSGDLIGYMGDSGYGEEGTRGKFIVHLHLGIYVDGGDGELAVNPYYVLRYIE